MNLNGIIVWKWPFLQLKSPISRALHLKWTKTSNDMPKLRSNFNDICALLGPTVCTQWTKHYFFGVPTNLRGVLADLLWSYQVWYFTLVEKAVLQSFDNTLLGLLMLVNGYKWDSFRKGSHCPLTCHAFLTLNRSCQQIVKMSNNPLNKHLILISVMNRQTIWRRSCAHAWFLCISP